MKSLTTMLNELPEETRGTIDHTRQGLRLNIGLGTRHQVVEVAEDGSDYVFTSAVLSAADVRRTEEGWSELTRLAWQRNADTNIVTFTFDQRDRLVGRVRHATATLDLEELEVYLKALVRECDRFEYLLSGLDRF